MNLTQRPLESIHRFSFLNIPLELTEGAVRETVQPQEVTHDGSRDAVPGPVHGPHGDAGSAQAAFVHVRGDLTRQAQGEESPTDANPHVITAVKDAALPVTNRCAPGAVSWLRNNWIHF